MDVSRQAISSAIQRWQLRRRVNRAAKKIAREIYPELWENVRRKLTPKINHAEVASYARVRAAQLSQERVDLLMQANLEFSGDLASRVVVRSAEIATGLVVSAASNLPRVAA